MTKREYMATHLAVGLAGNPKIAAGTVPAYAVILADRLMAYLNASPHGTDHPLPEQPSEATTYRKDKP